MKHPLALELEYRYPDHREAAPKALAAWHIETRFRYLADPGKWHCRHVLEQAIPSADQRARHEEIDLEPPMREITDSLSYESEACGVSFRLEVAPDLAPIRFDRGQVGNALIEMVHDALRGVALGQVEARELVARLTLLPGREIAICVDLRR